MDITDKTLCLLTERLLEKWSRDAMTSPWSNAKYPKVQIAVYSARHAAVAIGRALDDIEKIDAP
jgi:hypothetical protein